MSWRRLLTNSPLPRIAATATAVATAATASTAVAASQPSAARPSRHSAILSSHSLSFPLAHADAASSEEPPPHQSPPSGKSHSETAASSASFLSPWPSPQTPPLSRYAVADAVEHVLPAVVNIRRIATAPRSSHSFFSAVVPPTAPPAVEVSCGSGFFLSSDGLILTNAHVVRPPLRDPAHMLGVSAPLTPRDGDYRNHRHHHRYQHKRQTPAPSPIASATPVAAAGPADDDAHLQVTLSSGETYVARLVAIDDASDIALVRIQADRAFPVVELGASASVRPGEFVAAVGSPLALANSVSFGIVSTLARDLSPPAPGLNHLQLDVAINEGSSGGPVVALDGRVVGICSMKIAGDAEGIAFAIPIDYARRAVADLQTHGFVRRPYVGITLVSVTPDLLEYIRQDAGYRPPRWLEEEIRRTNCAKSVGLLVQDVAQGGPAMKAGLKMGDIIVAVNDIPTTTTSEFLAVLAAHVEKECVLHIRRAASGEPSEIRIKPEVLSNIL